jgi:HEAT repeat protein
MPTWCWSRRRVAGTRAEMRHMRQQVEELIRRLRGDDPTDRFRAAARLAGLGEDARDAVPALLDRLNDSDSATIQIAISALSRIDQASEAVTAAFLRALRESQDKYVRQEAIRALGTRPGAETTGALAECLSDADRDIRYYAAISLKLLGARAKEAAPSLRKLLDDEHEKAIRVQAEVALENMERD